MRYLLRSVGGPLGIVLAVLLAAGAAVLAQAPGKPVNASDDPFMREFVWRSIGPASMGGRVDDIEASPANPSVIYVGYATAGVWKSTNMGTTWTPIFDEYPVSSIGDIAIAPSNPDILYVGTGESNNRQSTTSGRGVYKSTDAGRTFTAVGLEDTHHISRVVVDPKDPNIVYVAAMGHLFGPNKERGLFKTIDGGKTWTNTSFIDENTGFTEVVMDPANSRVLYAASYQRQRTSWGFNGGGPGSAIWKTIDAGKTWTKLEGNGLPAGPYGRVGLAVFTANPKTVYAQIELGGGGAPGGPGAQQLEKADPSRSGVWRSDDAGKTWRLMSNNNNRPMYYSQIRVDPSNPDIVYTMGAPFYKSIDGGKTFRALAGFGHGDHHALWINPRNGKHLMLGTDGGFNISWDEGDTWDFINTIAVGQFYALGVDMRKPYYVCGGLQDNGSFCGPSATRSTNGITNADWYRVGGGDGFYNLVDPTDYNIVYTESQNGNMSRLDLRTGGRVNIRPRARPRQPPPSAAGQALAASNIVPEPPVGETYRWNWSTPIHISPHDTATIYAGANRFFKSTNRGDTWTMSQDLTKQIDRNTLSIMGVAGDQPMLSKNDGLPNYGNITTLAESPSRRDLIWVGTDDGNVQVSRDGGATWTNVAPLIPAPKSNYQVSRVEPSRFDPATCYVTIDNHRNDDWNPYAFVTRDYGKTWQSLGLAGLRGNVNVIEEDTRNPNLLFLGTEFGLYVSMNGGQEWRTLMTGLPNVRIDDILIHPRDNDLIVGTHGRSIYILDDITPLQQFASGAVKDTVHLFDVRPATQWAQDIQRLQQTTGSKRWRGENPPSGAMINYLIGAGVSGDAKITVTDLTGKTVRSLTGTNKTGLNRVRWDLRSDSPPRPATAPAGAPSQPGPLVEPGTYLVKLAIAGKEPVRPVIVEQDTWKN
jgi:photosystem II stability/assembly factor-like uncharacterized protein